MHPLRTSDKICLLITILAAGFFLIYTYILITDYIDHQVVVLPVESNDDWCYVKTIQPGEAISENSAGYYHYSLVTTSKGIEVYRLCAVKK